MSTVPVPDFWLVKIDETEHWIDSLRARVKRIWSVYLVDVSRYTHCCEVTPSYWLDFVESYADHLDSSDESDIEKLSEEISEAATADEQSMYVHVSDFTNAHPLDRLPRNRKYHLSRRGKRQEEVEYAREARRLERAQGHESEIEKLYEELLDSIQEYVHANQCL